jgi:two-component system, OmpR family, KDP operon response regulator KdpE
MTGNAPLLLVIEDEKPIRRFLRASLLSEGYRVSEAKTGQQGLTLALAQPPDLVILDFGLPDMDGLRIIEELRGWSQMPIIILSARDQEKNKVTALDRGADDYISKPFGVGELLARLRVALRHHARINDQSAPAARRFSVGDVCVDQEERRVWVRGQEVHFTPIEYRLLVTFVRHAGKILTHRFLLTEVWGPGHVEEVHYLRVFTAALRRKLEIDPARPRYLLTEQGVGYRLAAE